MKYTKIWTKNYGNLMLKRAQGKLPEMESSRSISQVLKNVILDGDKILDVGCGLGHYYISLKKRVKRDFEYVGIDVIEDYIKRAKILFKDEKNVNFKSGDIFDIPFKKDSFDVVMCNNFLHNLPSIDKPIHELLRVSKRYSIIRTLVGDRSFRIQEVRNSKWDKNSVTPPSKEFENNGQPKEYNFFNIYSRDYLESLILKNAPNATYRFMVDTSFNPKAIRDSAKKEGKLPNATTVIGKTQVNGYILMPWTFIEIWKN